MKNYKTFKGKTILITGHTGFKGSWLTAWLKQMGAELVGISLEPSTRPSHFSAACLAKDIIDLRIDIRNRLSLERAVLKFRPDFIFHLAAQALVGKSYNEPIDTFETNTLGTLHLLEALRKIEKPCVAVIITSDKCYDNVEWIWGYRENDALGGPDPYSTSKAAAELVIRSYIKSYFPNGTSKVRIASARAGNVIGGGDWSTDRIVPDCVKAWSKGHSVQLRNPSATRPWQHVLEPLSGYLNLAVALSKKPELHGEPFNFGPPPQQNQTVLELVQEMALHWDQVRWNDVSKMKDRPYESNLLKLNCDKALYYLGWRATMNFQDTVRMTAEWYQSYYKNPKNIITTTLDQIRSYVELARKERIPWAQ